VAFSGTVNIARQSPRVAILSGEWSGHNGHSGCAVAVASRSEMSTDWSCSALLCLKPCTQTAAVYSRRPVSLRRSIKLDNFCGRWNCRTMTHVTCHVTAVTTKMADDEDADAFMLFVVHLF